MKMPKLGPSHQTIYWIMSGLYACAYTGLLDKAVVAGLSALAYAWLAATPIN